MSSELVKLANELVDIRLACTLVGMEVPEIIGDSVKLRCPFGTFYHSDGGIRPAFRVYPRSNSAFCFSCSATYKPVNLISMAYGDDYEDAAAYLLRQIDYRGLSPDDMWNSLEETGAPPDTASLGQALRTYCSSISPDWDDAQFSTIIATRLGNCLSLLDKVNTDEDAKKWLSATKKIMSKVLKGE